MNTNKKIKIAFIKYGGLASSGTEKFLQNIAIKLPKDTFEVDYLYCDATPYIGSDFVHVNTDSRNIQPMLDAGVNLVKFDVKFKDATKRDFPWIETNFWDIFYKKKYDIIQTGRAGSPEYPFNKIRNTPIVDSIHFIAGIDNQFNISRVLHITKWSANIWVKRGGDKRRVEIISHPMIVNGNLGKSLRVDFNLENKIIYGFHQRNSDEIFSDIPLQAYKEIENENTHFILMGGGEKYREQARNIGIKNITFLDFSGDREKIYSFLKTLDIYAHGRYDGEVNSTAMAEAMYFGLPIISHISPIHNGHVECIGNAGKVVSTVKEYAKTMIDYSNNDIKKIISENAKKRFDDLYEEEKQMKKIIDIYMNVIKNPYPYKLRRYFYSLRIKFIFIKIIEKLAKYFKVITS